jgi:3-oxoacyl-[acyl-carrier-protein] synthase II
MAALAAKQAWTQAGVADAYAHERVGVMIGSSRGPLEKISESFHQLGNGGPLPSLSAQSSMGSLAGALAQVFKLKGPSAVVSAACASASFSMAMAAEQLLLGKADAMLAGGAEAPLHAVILSQLQSAGVLGSHEEAGRVCRPFDATRNGMVLGEGSAFFVLERAAGAQRRGAVALAKLAGWSSNIDSFGRTGVHEDGSGLLQVMAGALDVAGLSPGAIDYINAHGSGTVANDSAEAQAVNRLFRNRAVPCSSTKPVTGHCLGATPALEAILCVEVLRQQKLLPAVNCHRQDPGCPIHLASEPSQPEKITSVMSNSLGFWGYHAALIFSEA